MLHDFTQMTDDELCALWRGDDCAECRASLDEYGMLPSYCGYCGTKRGDSLFQELQRRGLLDRIWLEREADCER